MKITINGEPRYINDNEDYDAAWNRCPICDDSLFYESTRKPKDGQGYETIEEYKCETCNKVFEVVNIVFKEKKGEEIKAFY